jgi:hypothetical protein
MIEMDMVLSIPFYIIMALSYLVPVLLTFFCVWKAIRAEGATWKAAWILGACTPLLLYFYNNTSADLAWANRQKELANIERISIKGRSFTQLVSFGWLGDNFQMIAARRYGLRTFYVIEQSNIKLSDSPDPITPIVARIFSFQASNKCIRYADYLTEQSMNMLRPPTPPPSAGTNIVVQFDVGEKERKELVNAFVPTDQCLLQSFRKMKFSELPKNALFVSRSGVPSLTRANILRTERFEIRAYSDGKFKLVDAYEEEDTVRQSSPFCLPFFGSGMCETQQQPDRHRRSILEMLHTALTGNKFFDSQ